MVSEFEFINNIKSRFRLESVGDDCAVLPKDSATDMLITSDMLVEDVDFRLAWTTPEFLGHKALAVSLSDIAAMGGTARHAMLSLGIPQGLWKTDFLDRFYEGWHKLAETSGVELAGGDISSSPNGFVIDSTVIGEVAHGRAILRSGAKPGDALFVTGYLGGAAGGLTELEKGVRFDESLPAPLKHLLHRQLQPLPQLRTANLLTTHGFASAMLDISDGLSSDLGHLCGMSGVGCRIDVRSLPVDPAIGMVDGTLDGVDLALNGGEDFELLLAVDEKNFSAVQILGFHHLGQVTANVGMIELIDGETSTILEPHGYRHF